MTARPAGAGVVTALAPDAVPGNQALLRSSTGAHRQPGRAGFLRRQCACGGSAGVSGECAACREKGDGELQRLATDSAASTIAPAIVHDVLRSSAHAIDDETRTFMEPRFGQNFGAVRLHTDERAAQSARAVNALAYTVGRDIVFARGRFAPQTAAGRSLLAHELAHVVQQHGAEGSPPAHIEIGAAGSPAERDADRTARTVMQGPHRDPPASAVGINAATLHREVPESCEKYEPDADGVAKIVAGVLDFGRSAKYSINELETAWYTVRHRREKSDGSNCCNAELAAAEHYLYARYAVAHLDHSRLEMKALVWGYGYFKFLVPKTGICPKSPDTQGSRDWGYRGADDGAHDLEELA